MVNIKIRFWTTTNLNYANIKCQIRQKIRSRFNLISKYLFLEENKTVITLMTLVRILYFAHVIKSSIYKTICIQLNLEADCAITRMFEPIKIRSLLQLLVTERNKVKLKCQQFKYSRNVACDILNLAAYFIILYVILFLLKIVIS